MTKGRLRVGVNLLWLVPGVVGGSEEYLVRSLLALADHEAPDLDVTVFGLDVLGAAHPALAEAFPLVTVPLRGRAKGLRIAAETSWLAAETRRRSVEVMHHGGGVIPPLHPGRCVVTIHDIQPIDLPEHFSATKRRYLETMLPRTVAWASVIATSTGFVRDRLVDHYGADPARIHLVPPSLAERAEPRPTVDRIGEVLTRYDLRPGRYVIYPVITYPHKNHRVLVEAMLQVPPDVQLVLPGGMGPSEGEVRAAIADLGLGDRVHRLGRIPRGELDALLAAAGALTFPSRYEGFGIAVLEAMAIGLPVIVADATALPEVVGDGGLRVPAQDPTAWAMAINRVLGDRVARQRLIEAGWKRAEAFSTEKTAAALAGAYRAAGASRAASP